MFAQKVKRALKWSGKILGALLLVAVLGFAWMVYSFNKALEPIESVSKYEEVLADWKSGLIDHFPSSVPANARNVKFSSCPAFLQGGGHVQLRMELPAAEVKVLYDHATRSAKQHQDGGNSVTLVNERRDDGLWSTHPHTLAKGTYEFPSDYRIFIFDAAGSGDWNHGKSMGMVVSLQRNEVLYYAEYW
ncbi:hypothetical protein N9H45_00360 [Opitutales bacterium]|jgi:hypothetical protein|nr:hypothetical protein [Opitutales bacterium]